MLKIYTRYNVFAEANLEEFCVSDMKWLPLYPQNDICNNEMIGSYCIIGIEDENGDICANKYTILLQYREQELGTGIADKEEIDQYILFEKSYEHVMGPMEYPHPDDDTKWITFNLDDIADYGSFVHAYTSYKTARMRALQQFKNEHRAQF